MFRYYIIAIAAGNVLIGAVGGLIGLPGRTMPVAMLICLGFSVLFTALEFGLDALIACLVRMLSARAVDPFRRVYRVAKIPEAGALLVGFGKSKVLDMHNNEYLLTFMRESVYAEIMHVISAVAGFAFPLLCLLVPGWAWLVRMSLPVAIVNFVLQVLPVMVQRYVHPQLMSVYLRNQKRAERCVAKSE